MSFLSDVLKGGVGGFLTGGPTGALVGALGGAGADSSNRAGAGAAANQTPQFAKQLQPAIGTQLNRVGDTSVASFGGDRVADFTGFQQAGLDQTSGLAQALAGQAGTAATGFGDIAGGGRLNSNPFLEDSIAAMRESAVRDFGRNQVPAIRNTAVQSGGIGGSRQGIAEGLALSDLNQDLINSEAGLRQGQLNFDQNQQLQALINQGNILSGQTQGQDLLLRSGALQQGQNQAEIGGEREAFNEQNADQFARDQQLLSILLGTPANTPDVPSTTDPFSAGLGSSLIANQLFNRPNTTTPVGTTASGMGSGGTFNLIPNARGFTGGL